MLAGFKSLWITRRECAKARAADKLSVKRMAWRASMDASRSLLHFSNVRRSQRKGLKNNRYPLLLVFCHVCKWQINEDSGVVSKCFNNSSSLSAALAPSTSSRYILTASSLLRNVHLKTLPKAPAPSFSRNTNPANPSVDFPRDAHLPVTARCWLSCHPAQKSKNLKGPEAG